MTEMPQLDDPGTVNDSTPESPFVSLHTAVVLLAALVLGLVVGGLTVVAGTSIAGAVLAGLAAAGSSVPALRSLIGRPR
ncbi:hypothetical protein ABZ746_28640 [Streptomyces sp. NPDC020096]